MVQIIVKILHPTRIFVMSHDITHHAMFQHLLWAVCVTHPLCVRARIKPHPCLAGIGLIAPWLKLSVCRYQGLIQSRHSTVALQLLEGGRRATCNCY